MGAAALVLAGCGSDHQTEAAYDACASDVEEQLDTGQPDDFLALEDDGATIVVATDYPGGIPRDLADQVAVVVAGCVLDELDAPDSLARKIDGTSASDGRQGEEWDGDAGAYEVSWTYDTDNGLELIVEEA